MMVFYKTYGRRGLTKLIKFLLKEKLLQLHELEGVCIVHPEGFEPSTPRAEIWYSIQLNYGCFILSKFRIKVPEL